MVGLTAAGTLRAMASIGMAGMYTLSVLVSLLVFWLLSLLLVPGRPD